MSSFKDALAHDAATVFLNPAEFGEEMIIGGISMPAMWGEESAPGPDIHGATVDAWGLNTESVVLLVLQTAMPLPAPGQRLDVDGVSWQVKKVRPQMGIIRLELERNVS